VTEEQAILETGVTRGGRTKDRVTPERRCIATGDTCATDRLIRFVLSPDGEAVPDIASKLPGRGTWLTADRALVEKAVKKNLFSRAFRQPVGVPEDLADRLEAMITRRIIDFVSLARKAGQAVTGAEKVRARINGGDVAVLLQAHDGAADGRNKLSALARSASGGKIDQIALLTANELGLAFGREFAIHAALDAGGFAARVRDEAQRLTGLRRLPRPDGKSEPGSEQQTIGAGQISTSEDDSKGPELRTLEQDNT
jgi:predicted RNA-binding protein YlxR (DUF448 family)